MTTEPTNLTDQQPEEIECPECGAAPGVPCDCVVPAEVVAATIADMRARIDRLGEGIKGLAYLERRRSRERAVYAMTDKERTDALLFLAASVFPGAPKVFDDMLRARHPEVIADMTTEPSTNADPGEHRYNPMIYLNANYDGDDYREYPGGEHVPACVCPYCICPDRDGGWDGTIEPYCSECGAQVSLTEDGDSLLPAEHHRGDGGAGGPVEHYDAGHEPVIAWRPFVAPEDDEDEAAACAVCSDPIAVFQGRDGGWEHYRGSGEVGDPVEIFNTDHEATLGAPDGSR